MFELDAIGLNHFVSNFFSSVHLNFSLAFIMNVEWENIQATLYDSEFLVPSKVLNDGGNIKNR